LRLEVEHRGDGLRTASAQRQTVPGHQRPNVTPIKARQRVQLEKAGHMILHFALVQAARRQNASFVPNFPSQLNACLMYIAECQSMSQANRSQSLPRSR
jgi:hypothetical protein